MLPGDTMPFGECETCGCLVYQAIEPPTRAIKLLLNLNGGEHAADHLLTLHLDLTRLTKLAAMAAASDIDCIAIRPPFAVTSYDAIKAPPQGGYVADEAAIELLGCPSEDCDEVAEPTVRLGGLVLHIAGDGSCYAVGSGKHCDRRYDSEVFKLSALSEWAKASGPLASIKAA
ncbi:MAG: hypothetical protein Q8R98_25755 [Rubrivivax sp.]|nr:hypothetical protein [Rubrivivax sp.]